jgi:hypothetical protein
MSRLIDADALIMAIPDTRADIFENCRSCTLLDKEQITDIINNAPTIEAERQGFWIKEDKVPGSESEYSYMCSECLHGDVHNDNQKVHYCWNCGAKMSYLVDAGD